MQGRDFGSKIGSAGVASQQSEDMARKERLRQLALETIDLSKDPYFRKNYHGTFDCTLCLTVHNNEGNYLSHTQGKRHQSNLARRAVREVRGGSAASFLAPQTKTKVAPRRTVKIGRPGYRVTKQYDTESQAKSLLFQIEYPEIEENFQPRSRFMSAFEQRQETPDRKWQYILFAAEPYETIAFKIPNKEIVREAGTEKFFTYWDPDHKTFSLQLVFKPDEDGDNEEPNATAVNPPQ